MAFYFYTIIRTYRIVGVKMLDNIILYFKTYRILKRYVTERLKQSWKSF